jgi:hypothetical protein
VGRPPRGLPRDGPPALLEPQGDEPHRQGPKRLQPELRNRLRAVWNAPSRRECELRRDELAQWLHGRGQDPAAETLFRDWDDLTTFYDYPAEHWIHLRTSNPVESVFAGVRLRTNVSKRMRRRDSALYLVFKITQRLELGWRPLNGGLSLMTLLLRGKPASSTATTSRPTSSNRTTPEGRCQWPDPLGSRIEPGH